MFVSTATQGGGQEETFRSGDALVTQSTIHEQTAAGFLRQHRVRVTMCHQTVPEPSPLEDFLHTSSSVAVKSSSNLSYCHRSLDPW